jgi:abequosyltransferase
MTNTSILGIVIPTKNRPTFIKETLDEIYNGLNCLLEIIIVDGSTNNDTYQLFKNNFSNKNIKYFKQESQNGFDYDLNFGVIKSMSKYVWIFSDDDLISGNDINIIYDKIHNSLLDFDLFIINSAIYDIKIRKVIQQKFVQIDDCSGDNLNDLFINFIDYFSFLGGCIIKRNIWIESVPNQYFGSLFIHIGVIFNSKKKFNWVFISNPYIKIRYGNASWTANYQTIWLKLWPNLLNSLNLVDVELRKHLTKTTILNLIKKLIFIKALNLYDSKKLYELDLKISKNKLFVITSFITFLPQNLCQIISVIFAIIFNKKVMLYDLLNQKM